MLTFETLAFILFAILIALSIRKSDGNSILSVENCNYLRGIFSVMIIIFHVSKETDILYPVFKYCSVVAVGSFFFISGLGLMKGYLKKQDYEKDYLIKRFVRVILPYIIMTFVYWAYFWVSGTKYGFLEVLDRIRKFAPIVMYSWFIVSIIMQYLYFFILMKICRRNMKLMSIIVLVLFIIKLVLAVGFSHDDAELIDTSFCLGILYACYEEKIEGFIRKHHMVLIPLMALVTALSYMMSPYLNGTTQEILLHVAFIVFICSFLCLFRFESRILKYLAAISLEIYMTQGLSKMLVRRFLDVPLFFQDLAIYVICFMMSVVFHRLFDLIGTFLLKRFRRQ